jgi:hypothetical protein
MTTDTLKAPMPYYGACNGQTQSCGCLPQRLVLLFVDHRNRLRASTHAFTDFSWYSRRCFARWVLLLTSSKLANISLSLSPSIWCMPKPLGISPLTCSQRKRAYKIQTLGSAILIKARISPRRFLRVLTRMVPIEYLCSLVFPFTKQPRLSLMLTPFFSIV